MDNERFVTKNTEEAARHGGMGIEGLPIYIEAGSINPTIGIILANLVEAFRRIDELQREVPALKAPVATPHEADDE